MSRLHLNKLSASSEWITQAEAARLRRVVPSAISQLLNRGRLRSKLVSGRRLVCRADVLNFSSQAQGNPPSKHMMKTAAANVDREKWITQKEAAILRQTTTNAIQTAIKRGRLQTLKVHGVSFVNKEDVLNYRPRINYQPGDKVSIPPPTKEDPKDWISVAEAACIHGVKETTITTHATRGRIRSIKWGDTRLVRRQDILDFKRRLGAGRPKKVKQ